MSTSIVLTAALLLASASLAAGVAAPQGTLLFVHYRWMGDSLTLFESKRIPAKVKLSRLGAEGEKLGTRFLDEPGLRNRFTQTLVPGIHRVTAKVRDTTRLVRKDPEGLLMDSVSWQVNVTASTPVAESRSGQPPRLLSAEAGHAWFLTDGSSAVPGGITTFKVRLMSPDAKVLESRWTKGVSSPNPECQKLLVTRRCTNPSPGFLSGFNA